MQPFTSSTLVIHLAAIICVRNGVYNHQKANIGVPSKSFPADGASHNFFLSRRRTRPNTSCFSTFEPGRSILPAEGKLTAEKDICDDVDGYLTEELSSSSNDTDTTTITTSNSKAQLLPPQIKQQSEETEVYSVLSTPELDRRCQKLVDLGHGQLKHGDVQRMYWIMKTYVSKVGGVAAAKAVEQLLKRVIEEVNYGNNSVKVTSRMYSRVLDAWAKSGDINGVLRAEEILEMMEDQYQNGNDDAEPTTYSFNSVIDGWARVADKYEQAGKQAEALLTRMQKLDSADDSRNVKADTVTMNSLINAWSKCSGSGSAERAQQILEYMEKNSDENDIVAPNEISYTSVISAWANCDHPRSAEKAESILRRMETMHAKGNGGVKPNVFSYSSVINAYSRKGQAKMAERILRQMQSSYQAGDFDLKPNVITYNAVIKAWSQCRDDPNAAHRAELYLRSMQRMYKEGNLDVKPDLFSFNAVLNAWAKSLKWEAITRAGKILRYMEIQSENGKLDFKPNTVSYTAVIDAWAKSGCKNSGEVAERLLIRMQEKFERGEPTKPNLLTMNTVIDAHAKSSEQGKARNAQSVLRRIEAKYKEGDEQMLPNAFTYTTVLNACAFTFLKSDQEEAFQVAQSTYDEVINSDVTSPTHLTYGTYVKAINTLLPRDDKRRYLLIESAFSKCCEDGQLARFVLKCLQDALPNQSYLKLLRGNRKGVVSVNTEDLPREWRRNVKEKAVYFNQIREKKKVMKKRSRRR